MKKFNLTTLFLTIFTFSYSQTSPTNDALINRGDIKTRTCALQDYDNDGDLDFITIEEANSLISNSKTQLVWFENEPTRQFTKKVLIDKDIVRPEHLIVADFNKDGSKDYLVCMSSSVAVANDGELAWFQRQNNGKFIKWSIAASSHFDMADTADFNKDGLIDIVAVGFKRNNVSIFLNDGQFFTEKSIKTGVNQIDYVKAGDLDKDGDIDIVFTDGNYNFNIHINDGRANFTESKNLNDFTNRQYLGLNGLYIADINKDGTNDILTYDSYIFADLVWLDGANNWKENIILNEALLVRPLGGNIQTIDLNKDGLLDIVTHDYSSNLVLAIYQKPGLKFEHKVIDRYWNNSGPGQIAVGDIDKDQDLDVLFAENGNVDFDFSWYENIQGDLFRHTVNGEYTNATICKIADIDKDGDQDIILSCGGNINFEENELLLIQNLGNG